VTTRRAHRNGWQQQAAHLILSHTAVAATAITAAEQAHRRQPSEPVSCHFRNQSVQFVPELGMEIARELELPRVPPAELGRQVGRERATAWLNNAPRETLAARAARVTSADRRVAELEDDLRSAYEEIALRDNENLSLQTSLDLIASENSRLSVAAIDQLENIKSTMIEAEAERDELVFVLDQANENLQTETNALQARLRAAHKKLKLLQNSFHLKERQVQGLEQARAQLIDKTDKLLRTCKKRDAALARAEEKISVLTELFAQVVAKLSIAEDQKNVFELQSRLPREHRERTIANTVRRKAPQQFTVLQHQPENDEWLFGDAIFRNPVSRNVGVRGKRGRGP
jgi:hypothetical protein